MFMKYFVHATKFFVHSTVVSLQLVNEICVESPNTDSNFVLVIVAWGGSVDTV